MYFQSVLEGVWYGDLLNNKFKHRKEDKDSLNPLVPLFCP